MTESDNYGVPVLEIAASRRSRTAALYQLKSNHRESFISKWIPYFAFANRGICDMQIWTFVE